MFIAKIWYISETTHKFILKGVKLFVLTMIDYRLYSIYDHILEQREVFSGQKVTSHVLAWAIEIKCQE